MNWKYTRFIVSRLKRLLPVFADFVERMQGAAFTSYDVFCDFGPDKGNGADVVPQRVVVDRVFQFIDADVASPAFGS